MIAGADDIEQLKELDGEEFEQLCGMVGMDKKPFHVMRLKKALNRHSTNTNTTTSAPAKTHTQPPESKTTPITTPPTLATTASSAITTSSSSEQSSTSSHKSSSSFSSSSSSLGDKGGSIAGISRLEQKDRPLSKEFLDAMEKADQSLEAAGNKTSVGGGAGSGGGRGGSVSEGDKGNILFLPPYLQDTSESNAPLEELVDEQTSVQKTLGPCPFLPRMWDPERKELIRKYASIYGKNFSRRQKELLTPFEEQVNEGAYQLCLRDPTLLVRREELFLLAKRAVKEGGRYFHGLAKELDSGTIATTGQKRPRPLLSRGSGGGGGRGGSDIGLPAAKMLITSELLDEDAPKKMSGRMRQERMKELERLISANKTQQAAKLVELEQAQQLCNFSAAFSIQLEVESLGNACQQLQSSYAALKRKQRRSDRYYTLKERESAGVAAEGEGGSLVVVDVAAVDNGGEQIKASSSSHRQRKSLNPTRVGGGGGGTSPSATEGGGGVKRAGKRPPTVTAMVIPSSQSPAPPSSSSGSSSGKGGGAGGGKGAGGPPAASSGGQSSSEENGGVEGEDREVRDLVKNVSHATDEVNSIMIREFQKQLVWDL